MKVLLIACLLFLAPCIFTQEVDSQGEDEVLALESVKILIEKLREAAKGGAAKLREVIESSGIKDFINRLSGAARQAALRVIEFFKNKLARNTLQVEEGEAEEAYFLPRLGQRFQELRDIVRIVREGRKNGTPIKDIVESAEFKEAFDKLPERLQNLLKRIYEKIQQRRSAQTFSDIDEDVLVIDTVRGLFEKLRTAAKAGAAKLREALESSGVKDFINRLSGIAKRAALRIVDFFKNKLAQNQVEEDVTEEEIEEGYFLPRLGQRFQELRDIVRIVREGRKNGTPIKDIVESAEFKEAFDKLPERLQNLLKRVYEKVQQRREAKKGNF